MTEYQKLHITAETCRKKIQSARVDEVLRACWFEHLFRGG